MAKALGLVQIPPSGILCVAQAGEKRGVAGLSNPLLAKTAKEEDWPLSIIIKGQRDCFHKFLLGGETVMSRETAEAYRRLSPSERLRITFQMIEEAMPYLLKGTPDQVDRRFELLRRQNDERNRNMLTAIARTRDLP
jgi:hypothetical protein